MSKKRILNEVNKCYHNRQDLQVPYSFVLDTNTNISVILYNKLFYKSFEPNVIRFIRQRF